jgi:hypothetical protein
MCAGFFWVFYPLIFLDMASPSGFYSFMSNNGMINAYFCISTTVVTSIALSALMHGRIRIKDLMYGPFAGAAMIGASAVHIFNPIIAILLGMIAGLLQPLFNLI